MQPHGFVHAALQLPANGRWVLTKPIGGFVQIRLDVNFLFQKVESLIYQVGVILQDGKVRIQTRISGKTA